MTFNTATVSTLTWTRDNTKETGTMANSKEKVSMFFQMGKFIKVYGKMVL